VDIRNRVEDALTWNRNKASNRHPLGRGLRGKNGDFAGGLYQEVVIVLAYVFSLRFSLLILSLDYLLGVSQKYI